MNVFFKFNCFLLLKEEEAISGGGHGGAGSGQGGVQDSSVRGGRHAPGLSNFVGQLAAGPEISFRGLFPEWPNPLKATPQAASTFTLFKNIQMIFASKNSA